MSNCHLYFAYADNMDENIVRGVCPGAWLEGIGELRKYRFTFDANGRPTITKDENSSIWGVAWYLSNKDIYLLDKKEARESGEFKRITVEIIIEKVKPAQAFIYLTNYYGEPVINISLLDLVIDQAIYWALPGDYITYLKKLKQII